MLKTQEDYLDEINHQLAKSLPEQVEDLKRAVAQFCVAVDRYAKYVEDQS